MKTPETVEADEVMSHYGGVITPLGWTPMVTLRTDGGENVAVYLAPEAKGVCAVIRPNSRELIVGLITAREPLGDLIAQVVRAGGSEILPQILGRRAAHADVESQHANDEEVEPAAEETPASE
jgi:hypothetical protein